MNTDNIREMHHYHYMYRGGLENTFEKSVDNPEITFLKIKNKKHNITTTVDSCIVDKILNITWSPHDSNKSKKYYVKTNHNDYTYLHEYVLVLNNISKPDDGREYSVDHINHDTLDNRVENLRWATQTEQNINTDKRSRKYNARELPKGILEEYMPKFVNYNKEVYDKVNNKTREFFRIEKHPTIPNWSTSKSDKYTALEKLAQVYEHLNMQLPKQIRHVRVPDTNELSRCTLDSFVLQKDMLPRYVTFVKETEKRGCKFELAIPNTKRVCTSGSKKVSLKCKYNEMLQLLSKHESIARV